MDSLIKHEYVGRTLLERPHQYWIDLESLIRRKDDQGIYVDMGAPEWAKFCAKWSNWRDQSVKQVKDNNAPTHFISPKNRWQNGAGHGAGPMLWYAIHRRPRDFSNSIVEKQWLEVELPSKLYCESCAKEWLDLLKECPPDFQNQDAYFRWTVEIHNRVNKKLGRGRITFEDAARIHDYPLKYTDHVIFLPHVGEYGWLVLNYIRYIFEHPAKHKIVCCENGQQCLFPNATEFFTDWQNPIPDYKRCGDTAWTESAILQKQLYQDLRIKLLQKYPGASIQVVPEGHWLKAQHVKFKPQISNELGQVDIAIVARQRQFGTHRNWKHWSQVVSVLRSKGYRVGVLGHPDTSAEIDADTYAWNHSQGPTAGTVDILNNCKLAVGNDTGVSHLACMMDVPLYVFFDPDAFSMLDTMRWVHNGTLIAHELEAWRNPQLVIDTIIDYLTPKYYSGANEDRIVESLLPEQGYFVEIGGGDGIKQSNTLHFEQKGWQGLIFEPDPRLIQLCRHNRRCEVRDIAINPSSSNQKSFYLRILGWSGFDNQNREQTFETSYVKTSSLESQLDPQQYVDLLSIDTEGTELDIWNSLKYLRSKVVIVEANQEQELIVSFKERGYKQIGSKTSDNNLIFERLSLGFCTLWTKEIEAYASITMPNKQDYCKKWHLPFIEYTESLDTTRPPHWSKILILLKELQTNKYDWLFWNDADSYILNPEIELHSFIDDNYDVIWTCDGNGPNAGCFLVRNCNQVIDWLNRTNAREDLYNHHFFDQEALVQEAEKDPNLRVKVIKRYLLNSYTDEHRKTDFIVHMAGAHRDKLNDLKIILNQ